MAGVSNTSDVGAAVPSATQPDASKTMSVAEILGRIFGSHGDMMDAAEDAIVQDSPDCAEYGVTFARTNIGDYEVLAVECTRREAGGDAGFGGGCSGELGGSGALCEPETIPIESTSTEINTQDVCPSDPLADMEIRGTCDGIEGGRFGGRNGTHEGLDLLAEVGTDLHAINGGTVLEIDYDDGGWGDYVIVETDGGEYYLYAHLSSIAVSEDDVINSGDSLGETGTTGNACASGCECGPPHVHLEVRVGDTWDEAVAVDPEDHIGTEFNNSGNAASDTCS